MQRSSITSVVLAESRGNARAVQGKQVYLQAHVGRQMMQAYEYSHAKSEVRSVFGMVRPV